MNNLVLRATSGAVYVGLIVLSILFGGNWGFAALCMLFGALATIELNTLCAGGKQSAATLLTDVAGSLIIISAPALLLFYGTSQPVLSTAAFLCALVAYLLVRLTMQLYITGTNALQSMQASLAGQLYISLPLALASLTYLISGHAIIMLMFIMIWLNDTGAYLVGSRIGKRRLFERISPKKSWEGFFGGIAFCIAAAVVAKLCFTNQAPGMSIGAMCIYGVLVSIFATWGDLVESLIKRTLGVKDSGRMMPGHGGLLDRIDSLLFVAPMTFLYIALHFIL